MSVRLYFNESQNGAINCTAQVSTLWEQDINGTVAIWPTKKLGTTPDGNANQSHFTSSLGNGSNPCDILFGQFISDTMPSGVLINGSVTGNIVVREGNTSDNMYTQLGLYVVDSGGALVHTLLGGSTTGGSEFISPSANNRNLPRGGSTALSSYTTVNATSRIVAEIGIRTESTRTTAAGYMYFGAGTAGSDLPTGDGGDNSTTKRPWIEFTADIFTPPAGGGARSLAAVAASGYHEEEDPELRSWKRRRSGLLVR
jgi:hypothetical protein